MSPLFERVMMWVVAVTYGIWVLVKIAKDVFAVGFWEVFQKKSIAKPACLEDPSLGTHGILTLESAKIHYVASGPEDKPLMLFVHGFPEFWFSWRHQIREFQKDYRVVAYDQRGYGDSQKSKRASDYSLKYLVSDVREIILALGYKRCVLVGHDWGAVVAWSFGHRYPEMLDGLIAMSVPPLPIGIEFLNKHREQQKMSWYMMFFQLPFLPELYLRLKNFEALESCYGVTKTDGLCFSDAFHKPMTTEELNAYKYTFSQPGALTPPVNYYRVILGERELHDLKYDMPTLLLWGSKDRCFSVKCADLVEERMPYVTVKRIQEAGHFVQMDAPDQTNRAIREWLKGHTKTK